MGVLALGIFILLFVLWGWRWWWWWPPESFDAREHYIETVYVLLFVMWVSLVIVVAERSLRYNAAHDQSRTFVEQVAGALKDRNLDEASAIAERYHQSPSARVVGSGLASFQAATPILSDAEVIETTGRAMNRSAAVIHGEMKRGFNLLATVASTAPLVGAFGTVLGIQNSFRGCGAAKWVCMADTFERLSNALMLTALSLFVAVPATWCYKHLKSELEAFDMEMKNASLPLVNYVIIYLGKQKS